MSIKSLAEDDRPREKFLLKGKNSLSDSELLAIIMGSGSRDESAVELSRKILDSVQNNWHNLSRLGIKDLMKFKGVGEVKAISIITALEIGRRKAEQEIPQRAMIKDSKSAFEIFQPHLSDLYVEEFWAVFLNQSNKVLYQTKLTQGGINESIVDVRLLFRTALEHFATGVIVAHNHPSGNLKPSQMDLNITKKIVQAGNVLNISVMDHIIVGQNNYFSFANEGLL